MRIRNPTFIRDSMFDKAALRMSRQVQRLARKDAMTTHATQTIDFHIEWEGPKGRQVPVFVTATTNRLFKLVPLSLEGGANLSHYACLFAAAPRMLGALKTIQRWSWHTYRGAGEWRLVDAALAKAKGNTP